MRWKHKAAIQALLGKLPATLGNPIYYGLQCGLGGLRQSNPLSRLKAGIEVARRIHRSGRSVECASFLEVGTGHQLALPLSLWLCGASRVTTVDLNRYLKERLVIDDLQYVRSHPDEVRNLFTVEFPIQEFEERFEQLNSRDYSLRELLSVTNIRYEAPADAGDLPFESRSIDYQVSFTVLEHIPAEVLKRIFQEGCRLLKPAGLLVHYIDFTDHFAHSDDAISSINFLQFSEKEWGGMAGNRYMFHNRLRLDEFRDVLLDSGLRILGLESRVDAVAAELLSHGFPLNERFRSKDSLTNAAKEAWVVASPANTG